MRVERRRGHAGELHARSAGEVSQAVACPAALVIEAISPAVVLGSAQPSSDVDAGRAATAGVEIARRRSGGGAVMVGSERCLWVDVVIGRGDPRWDDDVGRASWWVGEVWAAALDSIGVEGAQVWQAPMRASPWSARVCFAGLGAGEVTVEGRKVVGISQRRTRHGALFQCAALIDADHRPLLDVLALQPNERAQAHEELAATTLGVGAAAAPQLERSVLDILLLQAEVA